MPDIVLTADGEEVARAWVTKENLVGIVEKIASHHYVPIEYPKWLGKDAINNDVVANNAEEEAAYQASHAPQESLETEPEHPEIEWQE